MRKTLVNTKFQWLMKYLDTDQEPTSSNPNNLSSAIRLHPHPPSTLLQPHPRPTHAARSTTLYPHKRTLTEEPACELKDPPIDSTLKCRPARSRINTRVKTDQSE